MCNTGEGLTARRKKEENKSQKRGNKKDQKIWVVYRVRSSLEEWEEVVRGWITVSFGWLTVRRRSSVSLCQRSVRAVGKNLEGADCRRRLSAFLPRFTTDTRVLAAYWSHLLMTTSAGTHTPGHRCNRSNSDPLETNLTRMSPVYSSGNLMGRQVCTLASPTLQVGLRSQRSAGSTAQVKDIWWSSPHLVWQLWSDIKTVTNRSQLTYWAELLWRLFNFALRCATR